MSKTRNILRLCDEQGRATLLIDIDEIARVSREGCTVKVLYKGSSLVTNEEFQSEQIAMDVMDYLDKNMKSYGTYDG